MDEPTALVIIALSGVSLIVACLVVAIRHDTRAMACGRAQGTYEQPTARVMTAYAPNGRLMDAVALDDLDELPVTKGVDV